MTDKDRMQLQGMILDYGLANVVIALREIVRAVGATAFYKGRADWSGIAGSLTKIYDNLTEKRPLN